MKKKDRQKFYCPKPNWNGESKWMKVFSQMFITCCDCGLAHTYKFKSDGKNVLWRIKRNKEQTKLARKTFNFPYAKL